MLKRAHKGVYHKISVKHLQRYVDEFAGRHGIRERGTLDQMQSVVAGDGRQTIDVSWIDRLVSARHSSRKDVPYV